MTNNYCAAEHRRRGFSLVTSTCFGAMKGIALAVLVVGGCSGDSPDKFLVKSDIARETLAKVLTSWQQGSTPESWQSRIPPVVVQDLEWSSGTKLDSFEVMGDGEAIDANLHCKVKLRLSDGPNGAGEKTVTYLVSTEPVLTVFRAAPQ